MRIPSGRPPADVAAAAPASEIARIEPASAVAPNATGAAAGSEKLQSAVLAPAMEALRALPDVDHAKVVALRDALARGELPFDATKLAALIERYHRSGKAGE